MAYSYSPISMPSSSGGGLDFGTLPRMQLGDTKSLTSFYDKQREHEDKESKFGQEEFTKLLKNLDADELEFAIGDDPRAREHLGQVTGYYTDKMKSLINRAGTPGTIKEMSKLSLDLYRDMNDPTGRLYPFVSAARERKKYLEKTKSAEYQKALAEDPDYDFENRQMFKNWKGSLSWNEEGMPQYNKLRIGEAEAPISLEGISKRLKGMVEESTIRGEEWVREFDPEGNLTGALKNIPSVKGRDPKAMAKLLREDKDFQRYINREMTKMEGASEEEKRKRREELQIGLLQGLSGFTMGDVSANVDDITTLNPEEQTDLKLKLDKFNEAKRHAAATESLGWANYSQRSQHHKDSQQAAERRHREKLSFAESQIKDKDKIRGVTTESMTLPNIRSAFFSEQPDAKGNFVLSKEKFSTLLKEKPEMADAIRNTPEYKQWFSKIKDFSGSDSHITPNQRLKNQAIRERRANADLTSFLASKDDQTLTSFVKKNNLHQGLTINQQLSWIPVNSDHGGVAKQDLDAMRQHLMKYDIPDGILKEEIKKLGDKKSRITHIAPVGTTGAFTVKIDGEANSFVIRPTDGKGVHQGDVQKVREQFGALLQKASDTEGNDRPMSKATIDTHRDNFKTMTLLSNSQPRQGFEKGYEKAIDFFGNTGQSKIVAPEGKPQLFNFEYYDTNDKTGKRERQRMPIRVTRMGNEFLVNFETHPDNIKTLVQVYGAQQPNPDNNPNTLLFRDTDSILRAANYLCSPDEKTLGITSIY